MYDFSHVSVNATNGTVWFFFCSLLISLASCGTFHREVLWELGLHDWIFKSQMLECSTSSSVGEDVDGSADGTGEA